MKKTIKSISILLIITLISCLLCSSKVEAASSSLSASATTVTAGTTVTLTATVTAGAWNVRITGNGVDQPLVGQTDVIGNKTVSTSASFTPQSAGTYTFTLSGDITDFDTDANTTVSKSVTITVNPKPDTGSSSSGSSSSSGGGSSSSSSSSSSSMTQKIPQESSPSTKKEKTKSSNNYLSEITLSTGTLSPEFYRETYDYTVEFDDTVDLKELTQIEVNAKAEDSRATVTGTGTINLQDGENTITLNVTAENGSVRTYTIKLTKQEKIEQSDLRLSTLVLNGVNSNGELQTVNFEFDPETFEYNLTVPNEITEISVNPTTEDENIIIETNGNTSLNEGKNTIVIILTSPDDEQIKTTYTLNVERQSAIAENTGLTKEQIGMIIIGAVVGIIILILIIVLIVRHRKKKKVFDYYDDDENDAEPINFINNEEGEDVADNNSTVEIDKDKNEPSETEEVEDPYPRKIEVKDDKDASSDNEEKNVDNKITENLNTTDNVKPAKLKWDDVCDTYEKDEEDDDKKSKNKKGGKRFL